MSYVWSSLNLIVEAERFCGKAQEWGVLTGSEILYSCKTLVVIRMTTAWCRSGIAASVDSAKPGSVLAAVQMLCFY